MVACAEDPSPTDAPTTTELEIFSWWIAPGEAEALDALIGAHHDRFPDVTLSNVVIPNINAGPEDQLQLRLFGDETTPASPPDLMQWNVDSVKARWIDRGAQFASLDEVFAAEQWEDKVRPEILEHCKVDGHYIFVPVGLHRQNSMMFAKQVLADAGVTSVPTTWDEFKAACEQVQAAGKTCLAVTQEAWVQNLLLTNVAIMTMGTEGYASYFGGTGDRDDPRIDEVATNMDYVLDNFVGGRASMRMNGWDEAAKDLFRGDAAFYLHGDWVVGLYKTLGWSERDFGVMATPGGPSLFVYTADGFMIPADSTHVEASLEVVRTFGAATTLAKFAAAKGASPPRTDVDVGADPIAAGVYAELQGATHLVPMTTGRVSEEDFRAFLSKQMNASAFAAAVRASMYPQ
jgi:glucose/mannose transport system substrate-binding protein